MSATTQPYQRENSIQSLYRYSERNIFSIHGEQNAQNEIDFVHDHKDWNQEEFIEYSV
jgi:hypothetical protein